MTNQHLKNPTSCVVLVLRVDKVIIIKFCKVARIVNVMFLRKFKKPISCFQIKVFFIVFFLCLSSVFIIFHSHFWPSSEQQRTHINKTSGVNKIIDYNYQIMAKSRYDAILNFPKNYLISSYLGVTLSSCNTKDNFCYTYLYAHKTQTFLWWCWLIWLSATFRSEKLICLIRAFSQ